MPRAAKPSAGHSDVGKNPRHWRVRVRAASHAATWTLGRLFPESIPLVFVVGYPKTGTTWACQLVADYLMLPYPRYSLLPVGCEAVVHGHELVKPWYRRGVYVMRDGRDALVSQYFFLTRFIAEGSNPTVPRLFRRLFPNLRDKADIAANLPIFLERILMRAVTSRPWHEHVRSFYEVRNSGVVLLRYEELVESGAAALAGAMARLTGEEPDLARGTLCLRKFSFDRLARKKVRHQGSAFLRKGRAGDWVNHFSRESAEIFDRFAGEALVQAGYQPDRSWVRAVPESVASQSPAERADVAEHATPSAP